MKVKLILPSLTEAKSVFWRPIKYSLFPPLGLATLASYLDEMDELTFRTSMPIDLLQHGGNINISLRKY